MLKKKNIAMVMAAATVATSVAPVFAAQVENKNVDEATLKAEVEKMLNTKYSYPSEDGDGNNDTNATDKGMEYTNSVYLIKNNTTPIKSIGDLEVAIAKAKNDKEVLTLTIVDKGHKTVNGRIVAVENNKNLVYASDAVDNKSVVLTDVVLSNPVIGTVTDKDGNKLIRLSNGTEIELGLGDYALDLAKPVDENGKLVDPTTTDVATGKKVVGFELKEGANSFEKDIPSKNMDNLVFNGTEVQKIDFKLDDLVVESSSTAGEGIYTNEGKALVELLGKANSDTDTDTTGPDQKNVVSVIKNGKEYQVKYVQTPDLGDVKVSKNGGYELTIKLEVVEKVVDFAGVHKANVEITVNSDVQKELAALRIQIANATDTTNLKTSKYDSLAGDNRFETAVKVSQEGFVASGGTADAVKIGAKGIVLVGENAIVDGLAAAPLASQKKSPILLTKKDTVPTSTMNEIKRVVANGSTVYLVGGENTISKEVEAQLIKEMNCKIVRLAGDNRYDTSLKISKELGAKASKAFVVGGEGLADAMSVAAVAAQTNSPIIVSPANGLTQDAKNFLYASRNEAGFDVDVIGGESRVSNQVIKDIEESTNSIDVERVSGLNRNDTNAKVIAKYLVNGNTKKLKNVFVAKDGDTQLVDALAAAPLAGRVDADADGSTGAIVLATNDLTKSQEDAIKATKTASNTMKQVGNGILIKVMDKVAALLK